jgi:hypothetical protein
MIPVVFADGENSTIPGFGSGQFRNPLRRVRLVRALNTVFGPQDAILITTCNFVKDPAIAKTTVAFLFAKELKQ